MSGGERSQAKQPSAARAGQLVIDARAGSPAIVRDTPALTAAAAAGCPARCGGCGGLVGRAVPLLGEAWQGGWRPV